MRPLCRHRKIAYLQISTFSSGNFCVLIVNKDRVGQLFYHFFAQTMPNRLVNFLLCRCMAQQDAIDIDDRHQLPRALVPDREAPQLNRPPSPRRDHALREPALRRRLAAELARPIGEDPPAASGARRLHPTDTAPELSMHEPVVDLHAIGQAGEVDIPNSADACRPPSPFTPMSNERKINTLLEAGNTLGAGGPV